MATAFAAVVTAFTAIVLEGTRRRYIEAVQGEGGEIAAAALAA